MKILVTGGAGFIGSNFIRHILNERAEVEIVNLDSLTYAGNLENLAAIKSPRLSFVRADIREQKVIRAVIDEGKFDAVLNFAAESHVDRSIAGPEQFLTTNFLGTANLLEVSRNAAIKCFVQISTDEVYGSVSEPGKTGEAAQLDPSSPYAATKAAADLLVLSYRRTYGLPVAIVRCCNNYGPFQFPEKLIPLMICNAMEGEALPVYGDGLHVRDWIYVEDACRAIAAVLFHGQVGSVYNIGDVASRTNLQVVRAILGELRLSEELVRFVKDRPGHDRRYAVDSSKIRRELGWEPRIDFVEGIKRTVRWYQENRRWVERCRNGEYQKYYARHYGAKVATTV